jgi:hypothetical protein
MAFCGCYGTVGAMFWRLDFVVIGVAVMAPTVGGAHNNSVAVMAPTVRRSLTQNKQNKAAIAHNLGARIAFCSGLFC